MRRSVCLFITPKLIKRLQSICLHAGFRQSNRKNFGLSTAHVIKKRRCDANCCWLFERTHEPRYLFIDPLASLLIVRGSRRTNRGIHNQGSNEMKTWCDGNWEKAFLVCLSIAWKDGDGEKIKKGFSLNLLPKCKTEFKLICCSYFLMPIKNCIKLLVVLAIFFNVISWFGFRKFYLNFFWSTIKFYGVFPVPLSES